KPTIYRFGHFWPLQTTYETKWCQTKNRNFERKVLICWAGEQEQPAAQAQTVCSRSKCGHHWLSSGWGVTSNGTVLHASIIPNAAIVYPRCGFNTAEHLRIRIATDTAAAWAPSSSFR